MNKILKTILLISVTALGSGVLAVPSAKATVVDELVVEWSINGSDWFPLSGRIFDEANFLPGDGVVRLIRVTNNSAQTERIATEAINQTNVGDLASQLDIIIKEGSNTIYSKTLKQFFNDGEIYLSSLAGSGGQTQYNFNVSFKSGANDDYQGKSAGFNLLVGFEGTEGGLPLPPPGGSAGGGSLPPGLTISDESVKVIDCCETSATIIWTTSYLSTSQVIYSTEGQNHILNLSALNYGYVNSKEGDDSGLEKISSHNVTITGLLSETTYYYRSVSHASPATISREYTFKTPALGTCSALNETGKESKVTGGEAFVYEGTGSGPAGAGEAVPEELTEGSVKGETTGETAVGQEEPGMGLEKLLAAIGSFFGSGNLCWLLLLLIIILIVLFLLSVSGKKQEKKKQWILPLIILILIILYSFLSCANYLWLVIIISLSAILFFLSRKKEKKE